MQHLIVWVHIFALHISVTAQNEAKFAIQTDRHTQTSRLQYLTGCFECVCVHVCAKTLPPIGSITPIATIREMHDTISVKVNRLDGHSAKRFLLLTCVNRAEPKTERKKQNKQQNRPMQPRIFGSSIKCC